uniref:Reverse transcriptase/retrotransposon-derived protein RNase H-like domain-containing protein n=1 Tax=Romanomermis culicivorax TaxID=13658 RepID=A0A915JRS2_ROMCU
MILTIPDVIVQPLTTTSMATGFPIETAIVNITNIWCNGANILSGIWQHCQARYMRSSTMTRIINLIAFEGIKKALTSLLFHHYLVYDGNTQFIIQTDTSMTAIGTILYQENGNDQWVIAYNSQVLTDPETQYSTTECKCLTIVYGFSFFFHKLLEWLKDEKHPNL